MPRKARVLLPGCPHHIVQRGHNRKAVFVESADFQYYHANLKEWKEVLDLKFHAWCLMTNHIHLIVEPLADPADISMLMKRVNGKQTAFVNRLEGRTGTLWEGRYKASPVQRESYLLACIRYVELNPLRAGIAANIDDYPWSSFRERAVVGPSSMLDFDYSYQALGKDHGSRVESYRNYLAQVVSPDEIRLIRLGLQRNQLTGNNRFVDEIEKRTGLRVELRGRGRPRRDQK
jgi:REP-associated tyrosine transposase